ncbi:9053_t:CDS:1, partial [Gigaspora margarita]
ARLKLEKEKKSLLDCVLEEKENIKPDKNEIEQYKGCEQDQLGKNRECTIYKAFKSPKYALNRRLIKKHKNRVLCKIKCSDLVTSQDKN